MKVAILLLYYRIRDALCSLFDNDNDPEFHVTTIYKASRCKVRDDDLIEKYKDYDFGTFNAEHIVFKNMLTYQVLHSIEFPQK